MELKIGIGIGDLEYHHGIRSKYWNYGLSVASIYYSTLVQYVIIVLQIY